MINENLNETLARAQELIDIQQPRKALDLFKGLPESDLLDPRSLLILGWAFENLNEVSIARFALELTLKKDLKPSQNAQALHFLGKCDLKEEKLGDARNNFERSKKIYSDLGDSNPAAFNCLYLARVDILEGQYEQAQNKIDEANDLFKKASPDHQGYKSHIYKSSAELARAQNELLAFKAFGLMATFNTIWWYGPEITLNYVLRIRSAI